MQLEPNPQLELNDVERMFVDVIADAIRHVNAFSKLRNPTRQVLIGEFATHLRRTTMSLTALGFSNIAHKEAWYHVAKPDGHYWNFQYRGKDGFRQMNTLHADRLCAMAVNIVKEEEIPDIMPRLNTLSQDITNLTVLVSRAKQLNVDAEGILTNLCATAEKLQ